MGEEVGAGEDDNNSLEAMKKEIERERLRGGEVGIDEEKNNWLKELKRERVTREEEMVVGGDDIRGITRGSRKTQKKV